MTVLSDEQVIQFDHAILHASSTSSAGAIRWEIERATIAALVARGGVDVEALAAEATTLTAMWGQGTVQSGDPVKVADALRLALAQHAAQHEQELASMDACCQASRADWQAREAKWRELDQLCCNNGPVSRERELRRELGVE